MLIVFSSEELVRNGICNVFALLLFTPVREQCGKSSILFSVFVIKRASSMGK